MFIDLSFTVRDLYKSRIKTLKSDMSRDKYSEGNTSQNAPYIVLWRIMEVALGHDFASLRGSTDLREVTLLLLLNRKHSFRLAR